MFDQSLDKSIDLKTENPSIEVSKMGQRWGKRKYLDFICNSFTFSLRIGLTDIPPSPTKAERPSLITQGIMINTTCREISYGIK